MALDAKYTTCHKCGRTPPEVNSFHYDSGGAVCFESGCNPMTSRYGDCDRCGRPSDCDRVDLDFGPRVCQTCHDEFRLRLDALHKDFMSNKR